jgi:hypothetical protein
MGRPPWSPSTPACAADLPAGPTTRHAAPRRQGDSGAGGRHTPTGGEDSVGEQTGDGDARVLGDLEVWGDPLPPEALPGPRQVVAA